MYINDEQQHNTLVVHVFNTRNSKRVFGIRVNKTR